MKKALFLMISVLVSANALAFDAQKIYGALNVEEKRELAANASKWSKDAGLLVCTKSVTTSTPARELYKCKIKTSNIWVQFSDAKILDTPAMLLYSSLDLAETSPLGLGEFSPGLADSSYTTDIRAKNIENIHCVSFVRKSTGQSNAHCNIDLN